MIKSEEKLPFIRTRFTFMSVSHTVYESRVEDYNQQVS
jgi:hypothetical protein